MHNKPQAAQAGPIQDVDTGNQSAVTGSSLWAHILKSNTNPHIWSSGTGAECANTIRTTNLSKFTTS